MWIDHFEFFIFHPLSRFKMVQHEKYHIEF